MHEGGGVKEVKRYFLPLFRVAQKDRGHEIPNPGELEERWSAGVSRVTISMSSRTDS